MRLDHLQRRHIWTILGSTLILAAFIVLTCTNLHVRDLPATPWACDEYECADPIYNLRTPYAITAGWALVTGTTRMLLMALGRPHRRCKFVRRPRRWRRALVNAVFVAGVAAGILLPCWVLMDDIVAWSVPAVSLTIALACYLTPEG